MNDRVFGEIEGYPEGSLFKNRKELSKAGLHRPTQAGISGSQDEGADSVVLSGGYDDIDLGDEIIYTGHGGRDERTGEIISNQELAGGNLALAISKDNGYPIRVIRGSDLKSAFAPSDGYRYDGLYLITDYWQEESNKQIVIKFKLVKVADQPALPKLSTKLKTQILSFSNSGELPGRKLFQSYRIIRDTKKSKEIKNLYDFHCQVCNLRLEGPLGPYAEAAHIKPLGSPHNGPDDQDNLICLCPNHHVLFDNYAFTINDDLSLSGIEGDLIIHQRHSLNKSYLSYRRDHMLKNNIVVSDFEKTIDQQR